MRVGVVAGGKSCSTLYESRRQAIGTEKFIDEVNQEKGKILVEDKKGRILQLVFR